jgi:hypothetical protein
MTDDNQGSDSSVAAILIVIFIIAVLVIGFFISFGREAGHGGM